MSEPTGWYVARTECRVCSHWCVSVFPNTADADALECSRCHGMTMEAVEYYPPDFDDVERLIHEVELAWHREDPE